MSRIAVPDIDRATGRTAELYGQIKAAIGSVPNAFAVMGAHGPAALRTMLAADTVLSTGTLTKRDRETIKLVVSSIAGSDYCVAAHNLLGTLAGLTPEALQQIRDGSPTGDLRRDALVRFVRTIAKKRGTISEQEFVAIKSAGYTDAQLVDISLAFALAVFTNVFNRINDTAIDFPAIEERDLVH
ncbi:putative peroxidase-related enzyme [Bradyrhizobium sp. S3.12.5]|uniref:carboxymuconolactone decarboxylase family protein n=1 Tax=Bradyrhizobium sp. S3.12.5 TaxID=3156386 RepID=UPI003395642F